MITSLETYILNISVRGIFEREIKLSKKNNTIWLDSYDEYDWSCSHWCGDTKDR